jgi:hypothetical protein
MSKTFESLDDAYRVAAEVLSGHCSPTLGAGLIAAISKKLGFPAVLAELDHLSHLAEDADIIDWDTNDLVSDIRDECAVLVAGMSKTG